VEVRRSQAGSGGHARADVTSKIAEGSPHSGDTAILLGAASTCATQRLNATAVPHQSLRDHLFTNSHSALVGMKAASRAGVRGRAPAGRP